MGGVLWPKFNKNFNFEKKKKKFHLRTTRPDGEEKNKKIRKMLEMSWKTPHANMSDFYFFPTSSRKIWQNLTNKKKKKKISKSGGNELKNAPREFEAILFFRFR